MMNSVNHWKHYLLGNIRLSCNNGIDFVKRTFYFLSRLRSPWILLLTPTYSPSDLDEDALACGRADTSSLVTGTKYCGCWQSFSDLHCWPYSWHDIHKLLDYLGLISKNNDTHDAKRSISLFLHFFIFFFITPFFSLPFFFSLFYFCSFLPLFHSLILW